MLSQIHKPYSVVKFYKYTVVLVVTTVTHVRNDTCISILYRQ